MRASLHPPSATARARRWRVPPPLTRTGEPLEGAEILNEIVSETGVLLWKSLRNISLWSAATPREQAELFASGARQRREAEILAVDIDDQLAEPLRLFASLLDNRADVRHEAVALACRKVAQWANEREAFRTALAFTQAAALACPGDAQLAFEVGRMARSQVQHARAESWYRRAIMLGRQTGNWSAYGRAYIGLGNLTMQRGSLPGARRMLIKALRAARRHGLTSIQAAAYHDLFAVAVHGESAIAAQRYAREAFHLYGAGHANLPLLAQDVCVLWVANGEFARAGRVLRVLLPHLSGGARMLALANLARAGGGAGDAATFESASREAQLLLRSHAQTRWAAQALLNLARGASGLGLWDQAADSARQAIHLASESGQNNVIFEAEAVLGYAQSRTRMEERTPQAEPLVQEWTADADQLEGEMVELLAGAA
jgi:tetratricopeptide (TPR) repeat protein